MSDTWCTTFNVVILVHCFETTAECTQSQMADNESSVEHLSVVMTTETVADVTQATAANVVTSSTSRAIVVYFRCAVTVIGVIGMAANALILYAMVASKQHMKHLLIFNQNVIDLFSCILLIITYASKLCNIYLTGSAGYWLCMLFLNDNLIWSSILASKTNLIFVTIERYLKVVYPVWSKKRLRNWMTYTAIAFAWITNFVHSTAVGIITSRLINGVCFAFLFWESQASQLAYGIWVFSYQCAFPLVIVIFCYWRILSAIRHQAKVMASHGNAGPSTSQAQSHQMQSNVIKTMIVVSAFYTVSDLPVHIYYLILNIHQHLAVNYYAYYLLVFISYFYFCANPFIYATKFDPVKKILLSLIPCKKIPMQRAESIEIGAVRVSKTSTARPCKWQVWWHGHDSYWKRKWSIRHCTACITLSERSLNLLILLQLLYSYYISTVCIILSAWLSFRCEIIIYRGLHKH